MIAASIVIEYNYISFMEGCILCSFAIMLSRFSLIKTKHRHVKIRSNGRISAALRYNEVLQLSF